jgi:hypothetical protein
MSKAVLVSIYQQLKFQAWRLNPYEVKEEEKKEV